MTIRIVSLGDSFTEGLGDYWPSSGHTEPLERGWADRVAQEIARHHPDDEVYYANLAIRGRKLRQIVSEQLDQAFALSPRPTLITFNGGGNDMLRWDFSLEKVMELSAEVVRRCEEQGIELLILTGGAPSKRLPSSERFTRISDGFTEEVKRLVAGKDRVSFVDNVHDTEFREDAYWSADRLHLSPWGHARIAARVLTAMGYATPMPEVADAPSLDSGLAAELAYWRAHVVPWIGRRLRGKSSGDGRAPKFPQWVRMTSEGLAL